MTDTRKYLRVNDWCHDHGISRRQFYREVAAGRIQIVKYGVRTLVPAGQTLPTSLPTIRSCIGGHDDGARWHNWDGQAIEKMPHSTQQGTRRHKT